VFTPVADGVTVYVQSRGQDNSLKGILIEDGRQANSPATILARSGQLIVTPQGPVVELVHGSRQQLDPKTGRLDLLTFQQNTINLAGNQQASYMTMEDAGAAPLAELYHPPLWMTPAQQSKWLVEAQRRLTAPLNVLSFTLIGLFAILGGAFRRHGGLLRPLSAVFAVTMLIALELGVVNFAAKHLALLPLIWLTALAPGAIAGALLFFPFGAPRQGARPVLPAGP
jgi:lipopolysaccharide export system permease protein